MKIEVKLQGLTKSVIVRQATGLETSLNQYNQNVRDWARAAYSILKYKSCVILVGGQDDCN